MNSNKSKRFVNVVAGAIAAAGILGGGALGLAAGANADTATTAQTHQERVAQAQAHDTEQFAETATGPTSGRALPLVRSSTGRPARPSPGSIPPTSARAKGPDRGLVSPSTVLFTPRAHKR